MERSNLSKDLKHHSVGERSMKDHQNMNNKKAKDSSSWEYCGNSSDLSGLISWPPRSYTCSFCKREFRSAQALGGHMNVHRRDRARLRDYSPPKDGQYPLLNLNLDSNPNPNPNPNPNQNPSYPPSSLSSPSTRFPPFTSTLSPSLSSPSLNEIRKWGVNSTPLYCLRDRNADLTKTKSSKTLFKIGEFESFARENECEVLKKAEIVTLDLGIGLISDSKEDLDLELRLGCS